MKIFVWVENFVRWEFLCSSAPGRCIIDYSWRYKSLVIGV